MLEPRHSLRRRATWLFVTMAGMVFSALPALGGEFQIAFDEGEGETTKAAGEPEQEGKVVKAEWIEGKKGKALAFNDYGNNLTKPKSSEATSVVFAHHEALAPKARVTMSAQVWLERKPFYYGGIAEKGSGYGSAFRLLVLRNGKLRASVGNKLLSVESPEPLSLQEWHDVQMAFDGAHLVLSIDGKQVAQADGTVETFDNKDSLILGTRLTGKIDEVKIVIE